jgi:ATP-dependent Lon protease
MIPELVPVLPLKETVVFPHVAAPLLVGQPRSLKLVGDVQLTHGQAALVLQRDPEREPVRAEDVYSVGTVASLEELRRPSDQVLMVLARGSERVRIREFVQATPYPIARIEPWPDRDEDTTEAEALTRSCRDLFQQLLELSPETAEQAASALAPFLSKVQLAYFIATNTSIPVAERQHILELHPVTAKLRRLVEILQHELEVHRLERKISDDTRETLSEQQRQLLLRERMRSIQKQLGDEGASDVADLRRRVESTPLPNEARPELERELSRLERIPDVSPEHWMIRTWIDWVLALPWSKPQGVAIDLQKAKEVLDEDHYNLEQVKERLLEYLAVKKLKEERQGVSPPSSAEVMQAEMMREPILCFVGPPGVGKTSLGQSIARSMQRRFVRISLGGVHDEAEIRGHRRTYIGAMPGRILQALKRAEASNPIFMLDEVDKLGAGIHGDPSAALLEVLDPAQNHAFVDTYLNLPFDLSKVLFICTANTTQTIPPALLDRMEVIPLAGYTDLEKLHIGRRYLLPRQAAANGLLEGELVVEDGAIQRVIREYTREPGVRGLERELASLARKAARSIVGGTKPPVRIGPDEVPRYLGRPKVFDEVAERVDRPGVATALAWTPTGGEVLFIEAALMPARREELTITGMLGDVMRESARAALTYARSNATRLGLDARWFDRKAIHLHVPAGAIPKDGPSAGVAMLAALVSMAARRPLRHKVAMTGELTLRGKVLPVGGIKEKVLAAHRARIETVILPRRNEAEVEDVPEDIRRTLTFVPVDSADEALAAALEPRPVPPPHVATSHAPTL